MAEEEGSGNFKRDSLWLLVLLGNVVRGVSSVTVGMFESLSEEPPAPSVAPSASETSAVVVMTSLSRVVDWVEVLAKGEVLEELGGVDEGRGGAFVVAIRVGVSVRGGLVIIAPPGGGVVGAVRTERGDGGGLVVGGGMVGVCVLYLMKNKRRK